MALSLFPRFGAFFDDFDAFGRVGPAVHVRENQETLVLELEVPRYKAEELKVEAQGNNLVITGNRTTGNDHYAYNQFLYGEAPMSQFRRAVYVPPTWDLSRVQHELNLGILQIRIPRARAPQPPQPLSIQGGTEQQQQPTGALQPATDNHGLQVISTSTPAEFRALAELKWPPKIKMDDTDDHITYTASLPPTVDKSHIDLSLHDRHLHLGVHHNRNVIKKDDKGRIVYNEDQSVSYSTNLLVPEGTTAGDISTNYENGALKIKVSKHTNPTQQLSVKSSM